MKDRNPSAFQDDLLKFSQEPDGAARAEIEQQLWQRYGAERAVLVLDMSGFSSLSHRFGIVHYLSMVRRMQLTAEPIVRHFSGTLIKFEADNCFAMFPDVMGAVRCARQLQSAFWQQNLDTPDELDIRIACGIDYGRILVVEDNDFFGNAVNRACKLGEDLAEAGEILITDDAVAQLPHGHGWKLRPQRFEISGLEIGAFALGVA